jgi:TRAF3-interacting protein 1
MIILFSDEEMNSSNITEKQAKLQFLDKLISYLSNVTGTSIDVKPNKIIAGLEPERTRYLLQVYAVVSTPKEAQAVTPAANLDMGIYSDDTIKPEPTQTKQVEGAVGVTEAPPTVVASDISETDAKQAVAPESESSPKIEEEVVLYEETEAQDTIVEESPDFESWLESGGDPKVM